MNTRIIQVVSATGISDYKLSIVFDDGTIQEVDFKPFLKAALHPDIRAYLDPQRFATFRIEYGDLIWGDYELCFPVMDLYKNQIEKKSSMEQAA